MEPIYVVLICFAVLAVTFGATFGCCFYFMHVKPKKQGVLAKKQAEALINEANSKVDIIIDNAKKEGKAEAEELKKAAEKDIAERKATISQSEAKLDARESTLDKREDAIISREAQIDQKRSEYEQKIQALDNKDKELQSKLDSVLGELEKPCSRNRKKKRSALRSKTKLRLFFPWLWKNMPKM